MACALHVCACVCVCVYVSLFLVGLHLCTGTVAVPWSHIFNGFYQGHQHDPCADHICRQYKSWNLVKKEDICLLIPCIWDCLVGWAQQETSAWWMRWKPWPKVGVLPLLKSSFLLQVLPPGTHHCRAPQSGRWEHRNSKSREGSSKQIQPGNKDQVFQSGKLLLAMTCLRLWSLGTHHNRVFFQMLCPCWVGGRPLVIQGRPLISSCSFHVLFT